MMLHISSHATATAHCICASPIRRAIKAFIAEPLGEGIAPRTIAVFDSVAAFANADLTDRCATLLRTWRRRDERSTALARNSSM